MLPNGIFVPEGFGEELLRAGDFEFEDAQEAYLHGGAGAIDDDCGELIRLIERGQWDEAESVFETVLGRLEDVHVSNRATRHKLERLHDEFYGALSSMKKSSSRRYGYLPTMRFLQRTSFSSLTERLPKKLLGIPKSWS